MDIKLSIDNLVGQQVRDAVHDADVVVHSDGHKHVFRLAIEELCREKDDGMLQISCGVQRGPGGRGVRILSARGHPRRRRIRRIAEGYGPAKCLVETSIVLESDQSCDGGFTMLLSHLHYLR